MIKIQNIKNDMLFSSTKKSNICKRLWFSFFAIYICKNISKSIKKNVSKKFSQKRIDDAKHFTINAVKATSKRAIQKTAVATGNLIGNKTVDKITQQFCESQKLHKRIIQKQMKKNFLEKYIHLQNKGRKLLMI